MARLAQQRSACVEVRATPRRTNAYSPPRALRSEPTDAPIRSPIGSLRRAATGMGVCWLTGARTTSVDGATSARLSTTCGVEVGLTTNGARCEPDCRKTALTMMMRLAAAAPRIATESTGRRAILGHIRPATNPIRPATAAPRPVPRFIRRRLRTIWSSDVRGRGRIADSEQFAPRHEQRILRRQWLARNVDETSYRRAAAHNPMHARLCRRAPFFLAGIVADAA
jgi:hypothetical protein